MLWLRRLVMEPFPDPLEESFPGTLQASGKHVIREGQRIVVVGQPMGGVSRQFLFKFQARIGSALKGITAGRATGVLDQPSNRFLLLVVLVMQ